MSSKARKYFAAFAVTLLATALAGCGSGNKEGAAPGGSALFGNVATVGDTACIQCHSATTDPVNGQAIVSEYQLNSPHNQDGLGCESCHGGGAMHNGVGPIPYTLTGGSDQIAARCATCHDGKTTLTVAGVPTVAPLSNSATAFNSSVHASGVNGTGPSNNRSSAPCFRCHTNEGAILADQYGLTGQLGAATTVYANGMTGILDDPNYKAAVPLVATYNPITCDTCHAHGGGLRPVTTRGTNGAIVTWNPDPAKVSNANDQFNLCTSCHNIIANDQTTVMASGNAVFGTNAYTGAATTSTGAAITPLQTLPIGHHQDDWYRTIGTTHYNNTDNPTFGISGYGLRTKATTALDPATGAYATRAATPCFDCHGHESRTNTSLVGKSTVTSQTAGGSVFYNSSSATIYTDWAQSAHAGFVLSQKLTAIQGKSGTAATDAAMNANSQEAPFGGDGASSHDFSGTSSQACQRCHTSTGASNYLTSTTAYDPTKNDFSNLAGWKAATPTTPSASKQREMIYCWACHSNAANGVLRNPGAITVTDKDSSGNLVYTFNGSQVTFKDVQASNTCVACHSGRQTGDYIANSTANFSNLSFQNSHYMAAAGTMYVKAGFIAFTAANTTVPGTTTTYGKSLTSTDDGGSISSTHRVFGSTAVIGNHGITSSQTNMTSGGPCVTCHMNDGGGKTKHTLEIDGYAYNNVCVNCHTTEGSKTGPVALTASNFQANFVQPNAEAMQSALKLATTILTQKYNITYNSDAYPYFYDLNKLDASGNPTAVKDWTRGGALSQADAKKLMGACFNINLLTREPAAYAHARTYSRRLIYDTIDWLDDNTMNLSVSQTAVTVDPADFQKGTNAYTDGTLGTIDPGTSEAMLYLVNWSRSTGKWVNNSATTAERP